MFYLVIKLFDILTCTFDIPTGIQRFLNVFQNTSLMINLDWIDLWLYLVYRLNQEKQVLAKPNMDVDKGWSFGSYDLLFIFSFINI